MDGNLQVSLDKLPIKRLEAIEENGLERFPTDVDYDEKRLSLIRRIDFAWAIEKDQEKKKQKSSKEASTPWQWQNMVENLQLAHQELHVIIDLINTVEANDAVTVASMTRPKQLPGEILSELAISAATKLQCFRHLGKYFKQSAKALEQQVAREGRFYGALIRLQQNWKVKRQRVAASTAGNEGFIIDLFDSLLYTTGTVIRPSSLSTVRVEHDAEGMLAINVTPTSCHCLEFSFVGDEPGDNPRAVNKNRSCFSEENQLTESEKEFSNDEGSVKKMHSVLRGVHLAIFSEQVFDLVNREAFNSSSGVSVTGIRENYLQLSLGQGTSVFLSLVSHRQDDRTSDRAETQNAESVILPLDSLDGVKLPDEKFETLERERRTPNKLSCEIYLKQIFHEHGFVRGNEKNISSSIRSAAQSGKDGSTLLGHFCVSLAHRIFSNKVLVELENVVSRVPYLQLISNPTWHSRTSCWTIFLKVPQSILHASCHSANLHQEEFAAKSLFRTKVVVNDDCVYVEGEDTPNAVGLFKGNSLDSCKVNRYDINLADLSVIILQQVASQIIHWLYEEALMVGIKTNRDFLCLSFELEQGETLSLVAHVDPEGSQGCISWWLVMENGLTEEGKLQLDITNGASEYRKFLGYLSLGVLYSTLLDLISLCSGGGGVGK